jgi:hypothetical protein
MITISMSEPEARLVIIALAYAARHGMEVFGDQNESVTQVKAVAARLENSVGDTLIGQQPLQR